MNSNRVLMESYSLTDGKAYLRYKALSEDEKKVFNKNVIRKLFESIKTKSYDIDYMDLERCNGDITRFSKYDDLKNGIDLLNRLYEENPSESPIEVKKCVRTLDVLVKYKSKFSKAFSENNELLIMTFTNISAALISATARLITIAIDFIKDDNTRTYKTIFKENASKKLTNDVYFRSLDRFLTLEKSGDLNKIFSNSSKISESFDFSYYENNYSLNEELGTIAMIGVAIIAAIFTLVYLIRDLVFMYYSNKQKLSKDLLAIAYMLEKHTYELDVSTSKGKAVYEKEMRVVEKLKYYSNKLNTEDKHAERKAEEQKKEEDKEIQDSSNDSITPPDENDDDGMIVL